ncbi:MAG TPA: aminoglycoside phosphotransferase family protein [Dictyobacter sp.]|nr:aminoglycoside phosphotransferase family protein [Dictyobacter sp.]
MQQDWERRHDFVALEGLPLPSMLQPAFAGKRLTSAELLTGGKCNTNYKIRIEGLTDTFVLRIYVRDISACERERDLFALIGKHIPVPEIVYSHMEDDQLPLTYAISHWVDGILFSDIQQSNDLTAINEGAYAIGETLAHIGNYTFPHAGFFGPNLTITGSDENNQNAFLTYFKQFLFADHAGQHLGPERTTRLWRFLEAHATDFQALDGATTLVHSDYKGFNILVRQQQQHWKVAAVLDWEFAMAGSQLMDIGNMLRYEHLLPPDFERAFMAGYRDQGGHLPPHWKQITKLVDLLSLCEFLSKPAPGAALITEVTALVDHTLDQWSTFA